nr:MAG TPA: peptidase [Caudoviricetes sp.]
MSTTHEENISGIKNSMSGNNAVFTTIKAQYPGSWNDDLTKIGNIIGMSPEDILKLNPWLAQNAFPANDHDYAVVQLKSGRSAGMGGNTGDNVNDFPDGYYVTNQWAMPLGVGTWFCSTGYKDKHKALDLTTGIPGQIAGYPVYASKAGTVVQCYTSDSWGNTILLRHDDTKDADGNCYYTRYAHLISLPSQKVNDKVSQGDKIGAVGNTGKSTGYHLHFQIYFTSSTRTDYAAFNATAPFSVNPNTIPEFPGIPYVENAYSKINFTKCEYITENDIEEFKRAIAGTEAENPMTESEWKEFTNGLVDKYLTGVKVDKNSDLGKYLNDFLHAQFDGIKQNGLEAVYNLMNGGNFFVTLQQFCESVVNNAVWYIENKVGEVLVNASQTFINNTKTGLKNWIYDSTNVDRNSELGKSLGNYLDSYIDTIVNLGWSAVRTAITTGDVRTAAEVLLVQTKNTSIDFVANAMVHGATTAIQAYIPTVIKDENISTAATAIATGVINVTIQSVGGVLKGQISIEQAAKNIISQTVISVTQIVYGQVVKPVITNWVSQGLTAAVTGVLSQLGITIGAEAGGVLGAAIGFIVGLILDLLFNLILQKLVGWFTQ